MVGRNSISGHDRFHWTHDLRAAVSLLKFYMRSNQSSFSHGLGSVSCDPPLAEELMNDS